MTLDEAIRHCEEVASICETDTDWGMGNHFIDRSGVADIIKCGEEHRQLAEWLRKLQRIEQTIKNNWTNGLGSGATLNKIEEILGE